MQVTLDGHELAVSEPTLHAALAAAVARAEASGRLVVAADADGEPVPDALLENPGAEPGWSCGVLSFQSEDPAALVSRSLMDARDAIGQAEADQDEAIEHAQLGKRDEAINAVRAAMEKWQAVQEVVLQGSRLLEIDLDRVRYLGPEGPDDTVPNAIEKLAAGLTSLARSVGDDDWVTAADLLDGELRTETARWSSMLEALASTAGRARQESGG